MEIKLHNIQKLIGGGGLSNYWYSGLMDYDPNKYTMNFTYDTSKLVNANDFSSPWSSSQPSIGIRYQPTSGYGAYGIGGQHFNFTKGIEESPEYKRFGENLIKDGKFTPLGEAWAKATDALLPSDSESRFFDKNNNLRTSWSPNIPDAHGRQARTFTNLEEYVNWVRNDQILGARHNIFLPSQKGVGFRYYYKDAMGIKHWVSPEDAAKYKKNTLSISTNGNGGTWTDFEITGEEVFPSRFGQQQQEVVTAPEQEEESAREPGRQRVQTEEGEYGFDWSKVKESAQKLFNNPELYALGRLAGNLINNERVYGHALKAIKPNLTSSYHTYRQVVGDEATKQAYYRRAAEGITKASRPMTSDADKQTAYQMEAQRAANELRAQGDLTDNQMIQKTSDESNQHQWANIARDNQVANTNRAAMNDVNARKQNLLAQRDSAQWSSIDNYLQGVEYRKRQQLAEQQQLNDQIWQLQIQEQMYEEPDLVKARAKLQQARKNHTDSTGMVDVNDQEVRDALKEYNLAYSRFMVKMYKQRYQKKNNPIEFDKKGSKITWKKKDDLLYKSAKDVVEHFRRMTKLAYDSVSKRPKEIKLVSHPKGSTKKYQQGGVAPFTIYKPVALGGETTTTSESSTSSTKKGSSDDLGQDLLKDLFKQLQASGLPSDVNAIYSRIGNLLQQQELFGNALSTEDIQSLYVSAMQQLSRIKYEKEQYDNVQTRVRAKEAGFEYAVTSDGRFVVQDQEGKIDYKSFEEINDKDTILTNDALLNLRAFYQPMNTLLTQIADNATSMSEIGKFLKAQLPVIENSETVIEGYTKKDAKLIKEGIEVLANAPEGDYKFSETKKSNAEQINMALDYLYRILPRNMQALLTANSGGEPKKLIQDLVMSKFNTTYKYELSPVTTGKSSSSTSKGVETEVKSNPLVQMIQGQGGTPRTLEYITRDSGVVMSVEGMEYSAIPKVYGDTSLKEMLNQSGLAAMIGKQGVTFGDQHINPEDFGDIMYSDSGAIVVTLPCKIVNNHKEVNLGVIDAYKKALDQVESQGITDKEEYEKALGEALKDQNLTSLLDANGLPDKNKFGQFLTVEAYTTTKLKGLDKSSQFVEKVSNPDDRLEQRIITALSTNKDKDDYSLDIDYYFWGDDVYRGTVFIPLSNNINAAINAYGDQVKLGESKEFENRYQNFNTRASNMKPSNSDLLYETE